MLARAGRVVMHPLTVWVAFVVVHLGLGLLCLYAPGWPMGDIPLYAYWVQLALDGQWVGIDTPWVYPVVAIVPMLLAAVFGPEQYSATWLSMIVLLNAVAFGFVTGWGRSRDRVSTAWWWVLFLALLGPIALARIDSVTVPLAIVGVLFLATRPALAGVLLAVATWVKVWPAAIIAAALVALRSRWRILGSVVLVSCGVLLVALLLGSRGNVLTFVTQQAGRGIQIESPVATPWLWQASFGVPGTEVYYDREILTFQVSGAGVDAVAAAMTPVLALAVAAILVLGVRAVRAGARPGDLLPALGLALVAAFIAFNKVGSPQFAMWLAAPVILGLAARAAGHARSFRVPAVLALVIAGLTHVVYPYLYGWLLDVHPLMLTVIGVRNLLYFVLLAWAVVAVVTAPGLIGRGRVGAAGALGVNDADATEPWLPSVWPFHDAPRVEPGDDREHEHARALAPGSPGLER